MTSLRSRLTNRGTETDASVQKRLSIALKELDYARQGNVHDFVIVNDDLERAYQLFKKVAQGEKVDNDQLPPFDD